MLVQVFASIALKNLSFCPLFIILNFIISLFKKKVYILSFFNTYLFKNGAKLYNLNDNSKLHNLAPLSSYSFLRFKSLILN